MKNTEKAFLNEEERKKQQQKSEEEIKKEQEKILKLEKKKEVIHEEEEVSNDLQKLRDLLEEHIVDDGLVEKVIAGTEIDHEDIQEIFEKIDEIEQIDKIDDYLPKDMRVTKEEYAQATHDDDACKVVIQKLEKSLTVLSQHANPQVWGSINLFSGFLTMLDKNLVTIQEHHIDMKDSLETQKTSSSIWELVKSAFK